MRVFVTGATGFVGEAVVKELISGGHQVLGLSRNEAKDAGLASAGAQVHRGSMEDLDSLRRGAAQADGVIHLAFNHDFSRFAANAEQDRQAILALGEALKGSERPMLVTSGLALLAQGRPAVEQDRPAPDFPRASEAAADAVAELGVRASAVRLAPSTHGVGDHGFIPILIGLARETGAAAYVGDGSNRWPGVHRFDAARVFRLALERGEAGARYHATDEEGVPFKAIAEVIGRRLDLPVVSKTPEAAEAHFGWFARFAGADIPASSAWTRKALGWTPRERGLLQDIDQPAYYGG